MDDEPRYVDNVDEINTNRRKVFQIPTTNFQKRILAAVRKKYFSPYREEEYSPIREIEKAMLSLNSNIVSKYPTEWIDNCIDWAIAKYRQGQFVGMKGLLSLIRNQDRKADFVTKWQNKNRNTKLFDLNDEEEPYRNELD
jgi:hypothetical protein